MGDELLVETSGDHGFVYVTKVRLHNTYVLVKLQYSITQCYAQMTLNGAH